MRTNIQNVHKMGFMFQITDFHSHNTSLNKTKDEKAHLEFVLAEFHMFTFCNAAGSKYHFVLDQVSFFSLWIL
jgi:hypothetical protein